MRAWAAEITVDERLALLGEGWDNTVRLAIGRGHDSGRAPGPRRARPRHPRTKVREAPGYSDASQHAIIRRVKEPLLRTPACLGDWPDPWEER